MKLIRMIDLGFEEDVRQIFDHFKYQRSKLYYFFFLPPCQKRFQEFGFNLL